MTVLVIIALAMGVFNLMLTFHEKVQRDKLERDVIKAIRMIAQKENNRR